MKIANNGVSSVVASEGVQTTSAFNIARTPHMFNILSSGLYSDKIAAVLREIGCNAMDAHIMGGCPDKPFQVKLPTTLDRSFYVKDWGPGLDDKELRELYTTYGWSSKQNNDDVTGAFGLGSKSPFAYTLQNEDDVDGFTIESSKNGRRAVYTCYIDETGAPAISCLYEGPSDADWPHGVKVTFPVQSRDISEFHEKARDIYRWFRVKPEVLGLSSPLEDVSFNFRGSFFAMKPTDAHYPDRSPCVVMGNVRYPLNPSRLRDLSKCEEALLNGNIMLSVPMGTVMMTPSREELEYTERTRKGIKEWLGKAVLEVCEKVHTDVMTPEPTMWAWYKKIQSYYDTLPYGIQWAIEEFLKFSGVTDDEIQRIRKAVREQTATMPDWVGDGLAGPQITYARDSVTGMYLRDANGDQIPDSTDRSGCRVWIYQTIRSGRNQSSVRRREVINGKVRNGSEMAAVQLPFLSDVQVFYSDAKQADARVRAAVREGNRERVAILTVPCRGTPLAYAKTYAEKLTGSKGIDGIPMNAVSTLEVPPEVELDKQRRKLAREQSPKDFFADTEIQYMSLNGNVVDTTLGEVEESDLFYLCVSHRTNQHKAKYFNSPENSKTHSFQGYYKENVLNALERIATELGLPVTGTILVGSEGQAKKLKLAEQGYKPFLSYIIEQIKEPAHWAKLVGSINRMPSIDFTQIRQAEDYGYFGILGHHASKASPFWMKFVSEFAESPVTLDILNFVAAAQKKENEADQPQILHILGTLSLRVTSSGIDTSSYSQLNYYEVQRAFREKYPSFEYFDQRKLKESMETNQDLAITFIRQALLLDEVQSKSMNAIELVTNDF